MRELVKEWNDRKLAHVAAIYASSDYEPKDKSDAVEQIEQAYERIKEEASMTDAERREIDELADTPFMQASRRNMARATEIVMPGADSIARLPGA